MTSETTTVGAGDVTYVQVGGCAWCNGDHVGLCPFVLEIEYHEDGRMKRVKFVSPDERHKLGADVVINIKPSSWEVT